MWDNLLIGLVGLLIGGGIAYAVYNWDRLAKRVQAWLAQRSFGKWMLSWAVAIIDFVFVGARRVLRITSQVQRKDSHAVETVSEEIVDESSEEFKQLMKEYNDGVRSKDLMPMLS